jgi:molybdopterin-guanine dinucleotide biosynthesis protein B
VLESLKGRLIGVVGWKNSGKTTVVESLVKHLSARGYRVGTVKHAPADVALQPGTKDSARHLGAGADVSAVSGDLTVVFGRTQGDDVETVAARYLSLCDVIIAEGFKHTHIPKVAVIAEGDDILRQTENIAAVVCGGSKPEGYRCFAPDETAALVEYLSEKDILKPPGGFTTLMVNGKAIPINAFVQTSLAGILRGFLTALRDIESPTDIQVTVKLR